MSGNKNWQPKVRINHHQQTIPPPWNTQNQIPGNHNQKDHWGLPRYPYGSNTACTHSHNRTWINNYINRNYAGNQWSSTPWDQTNRQNYWQDFRNNQSAHFNTSSDVTFNNSILNLLDSQWKVQEDTTQALSKITELQDNWTNDMFVTDIPTFRGVPKSFLDWILKVEKVAKLTERSHWELANAKAEEAVSKCISNIPHSTSWEECKWILWKTFPTCRQSSRQAAIL